MSKRNLKLLNIFQNIIMFFGFLTDWLFVFIALIIYIKRIIDKEISLSIFPFLKESIKFWFIPISVLSLFTLQIYTLGTMNQSVAKFLLRTGILQNSSEPLNNGLSIFIGYLNNDYGTIGIIALILSFYVFIFISIYHAYYYLYKKNVVYNHVKIKRLIYLIEMIFLPCILQVCIFINHSIMHDFSVLKFSIPLATIPFVLLPVLIFFVLDNRVLSKLKYDLRINQFNKIDFRLFILFILLFVAISSYVILEHPNYKNHFPEVNNSYQLVSESINKNTGYTDIVFSPDLEILENPPQRLSFSMKRVYKVNSPEYLSNSINNLKLNSSFNIVVMFINPPSENWIKFLSNSTLIKDENIYYFNYKQVNIQ